MIRAATIEDMEARAEAAEAERDALRDEVVRLKAALRTITDRYEFLCTNCDDGWAGQEDWNDVAQRERGRRRLIAYWNEGSSHEQDRVEEDTQQDHSS